MPSLWGGLASLGRGRPVLDESLIARHGEYERNRQALQHLARRWRLRPQLLVAIAKMETRMGLTGKGASSEAILDTCQNPPIRSQSDDWRGLTLGIKTAFRANERLAIQVEQVQYLGWGYAHHQTAKKPGSIDP